MIAMPSDNRTRDASSTEVSGSRSMPTSHGTHAHADRRDQRQPGQVREQCATHGTDEDCREGRPATEAAQRQHVGDSLQSDEQDESADAVRGSVRDERPDLILAGKEDVVCALPGDLAEKDGSRGDNYASQRRQEQRLALDNGTQDQCKPTDRDAQYACGQSNDQRPAEFGRVRPGEMRQPGNGQREVAKARPLAEAEEDQRPDARRQQAGKQDELQRRTAESDRLHHQEGTGNRRAKQRADRGEAAGRADHHLDLRRRLGGLGPADGPGGQAAAERDQRRLRPEHGTEDKRGQRGERDAGQFLGGKHTASLEAIGR